MRGREEAWRGVWDDETLPQKKTKKILLMKIVKLLTMMMAMMMKRQLTPAKVPQKQQTRLARW